MKYILHVENSPTIRAGVRGVCRRLPGIELVEAASLDDAKREIRALDLGALLPLLTCRIVILSACPPVVPGVVIVPKDGDWRRMLEAELRK